jgi:hypothetical protein
MRVALALAHCNGRVPQLVAQVESQVQRQQGLKPVDPTPGASQSRAWRDAEPRTAVGHVRVSHWQTVGVPMREDCAHYESRTYDDDRETARFCTLGLAPEAPWRCPDNCQSYERILMIASDFEAGSLKHTTPVEAEPDAPKEDIVDVLADAERIVGDAEAAVIGELDAEQPKQSWWRRRRRRDDGDDFRLSTR